MENILEAFSLYLMRNSEEVSLDFLLDGLQNPQCDTFFFGWHLSVWYLPQVSDRRRHDELAPGLAPSNFTKLINVFLQISVLDHCFHQICFALAIENLGGFWNVNEISHLVICIFL